MSSTRGSTRFVIVTGMSGSGRSTCLRALEDVGFFCVDNLPSGLLLELHDTLAERMATMPIAVGIDARAGQLLGDLDVALNKLRDAGVLPEVLFLDCADDVLIRRFAETRRKHPIWQAGTVTEAIAAERAAMLAIREHTTLRLETTDLNVHQLKRQVQRVFDPEHSAGMRLTVALVSFGYKHGLPRDADYVFDVRYLDNPYFVPALSPLTGLDAAVSDWVLGHGGMDALSKMAGLCDHVLPLHAQEGRALVTIALGCTGGQHRSVTLAEAMANHLRVLRLGRVYVEHRDCRVGPASAEP
ncbi:MAG: RNase adapter RapZ [Myxococcales bacterium]|nr:RNase adapter RapZ [Myxococcales bacterium]